jgi:hypothetical protein
VSDELNTNSAEQEHSPQPGDKSSLGLSPEIAGALAYLLGFISKPGVPRPQAYSLYVEDIRAHLVTKLDGEF